MHLHALLKYGWIMSTSCFSFMQAVYVMMSSADHGVHLFFKYRDMMAQQTMEKLSISDKVTTEYVKGLDAPAL